MSRDPRPGFRFSFLAWSILEEVHELEVLRSPAGWYLGAWDEQGPVARDSQYFATEAEALEALRTNSYIQRLNP